MYCHCHCWYLFEQRERKKEKIHDEHWVKCSRTEVAEIELRNFHDFFDFLIILLNTHIPRIASNSRWKWHEMNNIILSNRRCFVISHSIVYRRPQSKNGRSNRIKIKIVQQFIEPEKKRTHSVCDIVEYAHWLTFQRKTNFLLSDEENFAALLHTVVFLTTIVSVISVLSFKMSSMRWKFIDASSLRFIHVSDCKKYQTNKMNLEKNFFCSFFCRACIVLWH